MKKLLNTVYVNSPDRYLSLDGENLVISQDGTEIGRVPLHNIERIMTFGHAGASPALMGKCAKNGIELVFMSRNGHFIARVEGEVKGNVLLRRQQYRIADNEKGSLDIARNIISAKLFNSRWVLERMIRDHGARIDTELFGKKSEFLNNSIKQVRNCSDMDSLRGIEGEAASVYFSLFNDMILQQKNDFRFDTRNKRPPLDNVNALLSFAYSMATGMCTSALESAGLDPYVGFMHTDRPGRRSLALDMVEEIRSVLCDRFVLTLINKRLVSSDDFVKREDGAVLLTEDGRKNFFSAWQKRKSEELKHPFIEEKVEWGMLPYVQAMLLARYIRGDLDCYPPFMWK
ncbi:type I-C CRISPR-associated endonuclease Cas1c [Ruminococcus flavefaciens]|uniref:CRISPR-associated endonuclease Cas1 n=1 Tax=Ruminococcus flavefaciens TaxID=1265 RepID=A0A315YKV7_RUMFL|nr:type I-C CRISPR-associated endonuclease Cas1c [Ruminococcus flavefaciens]PWJ12148.1 CRISPR-associated protein Cas1 [Ruminococcus flavefaciens]SSA49636.1 CRISP-associated protein Cas1 [Ruminococcus flavefaciens]